MEPMPLDWIIYLIPAVRLYVSAYFHPLNYYSKELQPYIYNATSQVMIAYDNAMSFGTNVSSNTHSFMILIFFFDQLPKGNLSRRTI